MNPQLANLLKQLGLDPAMAMSPQGVQVLQLVGQLAAQNLAQPSAAMPQASRAPALPAPPMHEGMAELQRTDPYGMM